MPRHSIPDGSAVAYSYVRFSTPEQSKGDSLRRQTEAAEAYCRRRGWSLCEQSYKDLGVSAFRGANALVGNLGEFLKAVKSGAVEPGSALIVESIDRISRQGIDEGYDLIKHILKTGIRLVTLSPEREFDATATKSLSKGALEIQLILERAAEESERKAERLGGAWRMKKQHAREGKPQPKSGMALLTHCLPAWIEERGGKLYLIPKRAATVKRIFQLAANGYGSKLIVKKFIADGTPSMGAAGHWNASYVRQILFDRRAVGEYQPKRKRGRERDGDPIPGYFPAAVTEREWLAARAGAAQRRKLPGRTSEHHVNVFAGLLKNALGGDSYLCTTRPASAKKRQKKTRILFNNASHEGRGTCRTFPFDTFEAAILSCLAEIDPREILDNGDDGPDESLVLAGELASIEAKIAELEAELLKGDVAALAKVLRLLESQKADLTARLAEARQKDATPANVSWKEAKSLLAVLEKSPNPNDVRLRLRGVLRRIVEGIQLLVVPRGAVRFCLVQIDFHGGARRTYIIYHRPPLSNGKASQEGRRFVHSIVQSPDDGIGLSVGVDLRDAAEAAKVEKGFLRFDQSEMDLYAAASEPY